MALSFDDVQPVAGSARRRELIQAVRHADDTDERDWLEWKGTVDLTSQREVGKHLARNVLGMANRNPDAAARSCGGWAFVLAGAEPGSVHGVTPVDNADLEARIRSYLDPEGPAFDLAYEHVDGSTVLIVSVLPPQWGDPKRYLTKDIIDDAGRTRYARGSVFVRRNGATHQADDDEQRLIDRRMAATRGTVAVTVHPADGNAVVAAVDTSDEAINRWTDEESAGLLLPLLEQEEEEGERHEEQAQADFDVEEEEEGSLVARFGLPPAFPTAVQQALKNYERAWPTLRAAGVVPRPENRDPDEYRAQVEAWEERARGAGAVEALRRAVQGGHCRVDLTITNPTQRNFDAVRVEVRIPGDVEAVEDAYEIDSPGLGRKPRLWGSPAPTPFFDRFTSPVSNWTVGAHPGLLTSGPGVTIDNQASAKLTFSPVDLRPKTSERLPPVHLLVAADLAGQTIAATWRATARDADGEAEGTLTIDVSEQHLLPEDLLCHDEEE